MKGVQFHPDRIKNPYQARIQINKTYKNLGVFPTEEAAGEAYMAARIASPMPGRTYKSRLCSLAEAREFFTYDMMTGLLYWNVSRQPNIQAGDIAGTINGHGYNAVCLFGRVHLAHRLAWLLTHGQWPKGMIDHINGDPADNRIVNLREVTGAQNQANRGARKDNSTGLRGVRRQKSGKWSAQIQIGTFDTAEEARAAFLWMAQLCYGEFAPTERHPQSYAGRRIAPELKSTK